MNTSFDPLKLVNTYGAFGSITKKRTELVFKGSNLEKPSMVESDWFEIEFKCKPGAIDRRPCLISPYHYRLDWLMWFAAFQNAQQNQWLFTLAKKMLENDRRTIALVDSALITEKLKWIKVDHYDYKYAEIGGNWWDRKKIREFVRPVTLKMLNDYGI